MAHVIRHTYVADEYKPDGIQEIALILADPSRCMFLLASKSHDEATLTNHEKWYKFNYSLEKFTQERLTQLTAASALDNGKKLDLPPPNNLIATNFDVLPEDLTLSARP